MYAIIINMVRLINRKNIKIVSWGIYKLLKIQEMMTYLKNVNYPELSQCIYVTWHSNQFIVHGFKDRGKTSILISNSLDGDIVSYVAQKWGFKTKRGSSARKGAVAATKQLHDELKNGENIVITVDGPRGPYHEVKKGAIILSMETGVPIVPVNWYSEDKTFREMNSWDRMKFPVGPCKIMNLYGKPIYPQNKTEEELICEVKNALLELEQISPQKYKEAMESGLWEKK